MEDFVPVEGDSSTDCHVREDKYVRQQIDNLLQFIKTSSRTSRERSLGITKLQEAVMWFGMDLKDIHDGKSIYPESYNPASLKIEPAVDGLKL